MLKPLAGRFATLALIVLAVLSANSQQLQQKNSTPKEEQDQSGFNLVLPNHPARAGLRVPLKTLLLRRNLKIVNEQLADGITAVDVWADPASEGVSVRLSIIYNDLSNQEWWKDKKEKVLKTYTIRAGETLRPQELLAFGIEPFELKAERFEIPRPRTIEPGEAFEVVNLTRAFELVKIETAPQYTFMRDSQTYTLSFKNGYDKKINMVSITASDGQRRVASGMTRGGILSVGDWGIEPGEISQFDHFTLANGAKQLTIHVVLFEDGTFDGDEKLALRYLAQREGARLQAPRALRMIEEALAIDDAGLAEELEKIEARFWQMPEAMDKASAIELLKAKYPKLSEQTISQLYEELKSGFYDTRNVALMGIGELKRSLEAREGQPFFTRADRALMIRESLTWTKTRYEKIIASLK